MGVSDLHICAREGCEVKFTLKTHNQKYHSDECCRLATNSRIMDKYHEKRKRRAGEARLCVDCDTTKLSRYNDSDTCSACKSKRNINANKSVADMLSNVSWAV